MAGLSGQSSAAGARSAWPEIRDQFAAVAQLRWRIFINSMRNLRGRLEAVSWVLMGCLFAALGLGGMVGLGTAAWFVVSRGQTEWLAAVLWGIFLYWQIFPVMATAFAESFDSSNFLRFPLRYRSYFFIRMAYGALDPATLVASLWLLGIFAGIAIASPLLIPWAALVLATFAAFNILLNRALFAWIERWLARRKSREILGIVFFLLIVSVQFIGPLTARFGHRAHRSLSTYSAIILSAERLFPPGLAGSALAHATHAQHAAAAGAFGLLCLYAAACLWILDLRLRAQFHGELISDAIAPVAAHDKREKKIAAPEGWDLPGFSGPVAAVFQKEVRYLSRSSPTIFALLMPIVILFILHLDHSTMSAAHARALPPHHPGFAISAYAFPIGAAYALMVLTNLIYNSLGADGGGVQIYYVVPVRFRDVLLGKNLTHAAVMAVQMVLLLLATRFLFGPMPVGIVLATLAALLFAAAVNFSVGDCLSLLAPKKMDLAVFGRQRASNITAFAGLGVQIVIFGLVAGAFAIAHFFGGLWLAVVLNLAFAAAALAGYAVLLGRIDNLARSRREEIISALLRA
jgi:ABC-2 type transport system permease protein